MLEDMLACSDTSRIIRIKSFLAVKMKIVAQI